MARIISSTDLGGVFGALVLAANFATPLRAQNNAIADLQGKISAAQVAQQTFAKVLSHCSELNGSNFYFTLRDRVLSLDDYHRSLASLALAGGFNPDTKRPWTKADADARWAQAQQQARQDKANCELAASLPDLQKKLQALQQQAAATQNGPSANSK